MRSRLPLSPANLPASPRQLTVRTCTRHHSIPTPDEHWSGVSPIPLVHLFCNKHPPSSHPSPSYLIDSLSLPGGSIPKRPVRLHSPRARTASHRVALIRSQQQTRHRYRRKQALNSLSHHDQEQQPSACAFLPSPAALDHNTTTPGTHRRSLSAVLTRSTTSLL